MFREQFHFFSLHIVSIHIPFGITNAWKFYDLDTSNALTPQRIHTLRLKQAIPDSKVQGANMGPIWGRQDPGGPHVSPMNFAIWDYFT